MYNLYCKIDGEHVVVMCVNMYICIYTICTDVHRVTLLFQVPWLIRRIDQHSSYSASRYPIGSVIGVSGWNHRCLPIIRPCPWVNFQPYAKPAIGCILDADKNRKRCDSWIEEYPVFSVARYPVAVCWLHLTW